MRRKWILSALTATGVALAVIVWQTSGQVPPAQVPAPPVQASQVSAPQVPALQVQAPVIAARRADNVAPPVKAEASLPIRQVVLFNSGVSYFQREGEVNGDARVDLSFPTGDINDLLKSLILQDLSGGRVSSVNYDSHDPIEKILHSFALDLNGNPTVAQILGQARGEKIEVLLKAANKDEKPTRQTGIIVGMEPLKNAYMADIAENLNLSGENGLTSIRLDQVQSIRFLNPVLEGEFQKALRVLATSHDAQKKTVSLGFSGQGKRSVRVGYVVEHPIWKTSYRLRMEPNDKVFIQGWAVVENTSDDDWNDVRMVLVSGRPISYSMNMYEPLYIPRPTVEPELFASLRPPVYGGALMGQYPGTMPGQAGAGSGRIQFAPTFVAPQMQWAAPQPTAPGFYAPNMPMPAMPPYPSGGNPNEPPAPSIPPGAVPPGSPPDSAFGQPPTSVSPNIGPSMPPMPMAPYPGPGGMGGPSPYAGWYPQDYGYGVPQGQVPNYGYGQAQNAFGDGLNGLGNKLTYDQLQQRRFILQQQRAQAKHDGAAIAGLNFKEGIASIASADELGDYYKYTLDQKITLPRQKSAMLPILDQTIEGSKVSIYNPAVHAKFPLLGLRLKNSSGQPLNQGPITVYEDGVYAGDTRILDLQPNEERFLSYALDQAVEIKSEVKCSPSPDMNLSITDSNLTANYKLRQTRTYTIKNRAGKERTVILEHPLRTNLETALVPSGYGYGGYPYYARYQYEPAREAVVRNDGVPVLHRKAPLDSSTWQLVEPKKPLETTRDLHRFQVKVPAGKTISFDVVEEQGHTDHLALHVPQILLETGPLPREEWERNLQQATLGLIQETVGIKALNQNSPDQLLALKIDKGLVFPTLKSRVSKTYFVQNNPDVTRTLTIDHIVKAGWIRPAEKGEPQKGPDVYRFTLTVPAGKTVHKEIIEERTYEEPGTLVRELTEEKIRKYLASSVIGDDVKATLSKFLAMNDKIGETSKRLDHQRQQLQQLSADQTRLRENLKIIPQSSEPYKQFLEKFVAQEREIENFQKQIRQLQATQQQQQREMEVSFTAPRTPQVPVGIPTAIPQSGPDEMLPQQVPPPPTKGGSYSPQTPGGWGS